MEVGIVAGVECIKVRRNGGQDSRRRVSAIAYEAEKKLIQIFHHPLWGYPVRRKSRPG